jgi:hypothetical protein
MKSSRNRQNFVGFSAPVGFRKVKSMKTLTVDHRVKDSLSSLYEPRKLSATAHDFSRKSCAVAESLGLFWS